MRMFSFNCLKRFSWAFLALASPLEAFSLGLELGVRQDDLQWTIAGDKGRPNILSELKWNNIWSIDTQVDLAFPLVKNFGFIGSFNVGKIFSGKTVDLDYHENNRRGLFSESHSLADQGYVLDFEGAIVGVYPTSYGIFREVTGFCYHKLRLSSIGGKLTNSDLEYVDKPLRGLDSRYTAIFWGPYIGFGLTSQFSMCVLDIQYTYTFPFYRGNGYWNLRDDFAGDFIHQANTGYGNTLTATAAYSFSKSWTFGLSGEGNYFKMRNGYDTTPCYLDDGRRAVSKTKLNYVLWRNFSIYFYIQYEFGIEENPRMSTRERLRRRFGDGAV